MFAETLHEFLAAKYDVVGPVADGAALLLAAAELTPDLAVVDIGLTLPNGLNASCQLRQKFPSIKVVCMTQQREPTMVTEVFRRGASAFLVKSSPVAELLTAIEEALLDAFTSRRRWRTKSSAIFCIPTGGRSPGSV